MRRQKDGHSNDCESPQINWFHKTSPGQPQNKFQTNHSQPYHAEAANLVKIGPVYSDIFGAICRFLPYRRKSFINSDIVITRVTQANLTKFLHNAGK